MNYKDTGKRIIKAIGGTKNVKSISYCATRLRFKLYDNSKVDIQSLEEDDSVLGIRETKETLQIVIGTEVGEVYQGIVDETELFGEGSLEDDKEIDDADKMGSKSEKSLFDKFLATISAIFTPYIPVLATAGIIKGLIAIANNIGILSAESSTYAILSAAGNSLIYFFPILLAFTAAKEFEANPYTGAVIAAALMEPNITGIVETGKEITFLGIPFTAMSFASTVIPVILAMYGYAYLENFLKKHLPKSMKFIFIPLISLLVMVPLTLMVIGPIGGVLANGVAFVYKYLIETNLVLTGVIFGAFFIFVIMTGMHWVVLPLELQYLAEHGYEYTLATGGLGNYALLGICFAVWLTTENNKLKSVAGSAAFVNFLSGVTEPGIYGVLFKKKKYFIALIAGGALGGLVSGLLNVYVTAFAFSGLFGFPAFMASPKIVGYVISIVVSFSVAFGLTYFMDRRENKKAEKEV
ncbi:PTS system beta-glucoside-specific IIA component (Glc family) /PTS system beta-glucoside-specific IIB component (Glc family) /PTS system beta-glucoside-specific IIC component (Glc family) [Halanaerobium saccharolyticum]|uniref:PTS system beta-glucoside-specific IIA component (Glc family) /PTS system beta-glucoside-specific IIB component (Glc family) /PTS system beta-glucoside-specific IIC component (Glc family) n=1 Tax=Halanaerobium saccharolyticum TaxID=43595 RepID=A0A4R7ZBB1_9FIRM|nr:PTS transporter subunit EIIC [Halanaerobium saccharolyticum]RAK11692.1 PTS system beta-glucoside-specific IIA component (Glc family) /PTS system beta-glucoside-specific IIB component (Glc family) /PTS system beta-glucoside-specific IIC component (Glc family) [Halanaerobium saccharolyticum]TDW07533.1 PTS system beta-glucoside-specific IIA component (Glc family) /PTS system beta-glucoside-specific IIB component (Glc family) /PTS system beta-glucoside-specific IIC component (Glc family) [Halanaer